MKLLIVMPGAKRKTEGGREVGRKGDEEREKGMELTFDVC